MKKLLVIFACVLLATAAFGQWDVIKGPVDYPSYTDAVALNATTVLTIDDNIVRKTTNFGQDWTEILLPDGVDVNGIDAASETVAYICADDGLVFKTENAGDSWTQVGDTVNFVWDLESIDAYNEYTVFIGADDGYFMKTVNSGTSWDTVYVADEDIDCGVVFTSLTNGVIAPDGNVGKVWHTDDGGDTWTDVELSWPAGLISKRLYDVSGAPGTNTVVLTGYHNVIWLSTDGGATFSVTGDYSYGYERNTGIQAFSADSILAFTSDSQILTTIDGGTRWDTLSPGTGQSYQAHAYTSLDNGLLFARYGQEYSTTDGAAYVPLNDWPALSFWGLAFPSDDKVMLGAWGGGELSLSTDDGASFSYPDNYASETVENIYQLHFLDENTGLLGGGSGMLKKTTDGGATWVDIDNPMVQQTNKHINMMHVASDGTIYAGGSSGIIMRSTDDGDTWEEVDNEASNTVYSMTVLSNGLGFACMNRSTFAISKTTALDSFKVVDPDFGYAVFRSVKERNGVVIVGGSDAVFRTTVDDLDTLYEVFTEPDGSDFYAVEFVNDTTIYAVGSKGIVYRSLDTGDTWEKMSTAAEDYESTLSALAYNGDKLYAVGQNGIVMSYDIDEGEVAVDAVPDEFALSQNYPNPFNPETTVKFAIPNDEMVSLNVYNITGRKVAELIKGQMKAGYYNVNFDAGMLPSGIYIYRLKAGDNTAVRKMTLMK